LPARSEESPPVPDSRKKPPCRRCRLAAVLAGMGIAGVVGAMVYVGSIGRPVRDGPGEPNGRSAPSPPPTDPDSRLRRMVIGDWEDSYQGKRTMSLKADGTGTMVVELSGWRAALSGPRLRFDMVWSVAGGRLKKRTVGGEPGIQVRMILKTMGDRVDEPILELTEDRLLLLDQDGKTKYDWRRVRLH
jgi:hypothetical protein